MSLVKITNHNHELNGIFDEQLQEKKWMSHSENSAFFETCDYKHYKKEAINYNFFISIRNISWAMVSKNKQRCKHP